VVSDIARGQSADEGLRFLGEAKRRGVAKPTIFTVARYEPDRGVPPYAFGITNRVDELLNLILDVLERRDASRAAAGYLTALSENAWAHRAP
jgi:hypothetical protein